MPRKPKNDHPLRRLRETIGYTQDMLARMLGVSKATVQSIELGRMPMSEELTLKIRQQTGCLLSGAGSGPQSVAQRAVYIGTMRDLTKNDFVEHQQNMAEFAEKEFEHQAVAVARCINLLLHAAARRGGGDVLAICVDFERFIMNAYEKHELKTQMTALVREKKLRYVGRGEPNNDIKNYPLAPLSTAYSFLLPTENPCKVEDLADIGN